MLKREPHWHNKMISTQTTVYSTNCSPDEDIVAMNMKMHQEYIHGLIIQKGTLYDQCPLEWISYLLVRVFSRRYWGLIGDTEDSTFTTASTEADKITSSSSITAIQMIPFLQLDKRIVLPFKSGKNFSNTNIDKGWVHQHNIWVWESFLRMRWGPYLPIEWGSYTFVNFELLPRPRLFPAIILVFANSASIHPKNIRLGECCMIK